MEAITIGAIFGGCATCLTAVFASLTAFIKSTNLKLRSVKCLCVHVEFHEKSTPPTTRIPIPTPPQSQQNSQNSNSSFREPAPPDNYLHQLQARPSSESSLFRTYKRNHRHSLPHSDPYVHFPRLSTNAIDPNESPPPKLRNRSRSEDSPPKRRGNHRHSLPHSDPYVHFPRLSTNAIDPNESPPPKLRNRSRSKDSPPKRFDHPSRSEDSPPKRRDHPSRSEDSVSIHIHRDHHNRV
jgi:hypothetical protein